jgi:hypothetical protein
LIAKWRRPEDVGKVLKTHAQLIEFRMEGWVAYQSDTISAGCIWSEIINLAHIMTASEVDVLALSIFGE